MKKIGLILVLLVAFSIISSAQVQDSVFLKSGKIIPCDINNIYDNYISYNYIHENGDTITEKRLTDQIAEIILRDGTSWNTYKQTKTKLYQSKVCTPDCSKGILYETFDSEISFIDNYKINDPYLFKEMKIAVDRIYEAIQDQELIAIHGDYDADGVSATAILQSVLRELGAQVTIYIPHREKEGYGLNKQTIDYLHKRGVSLVITCDCGISNHDEIAYAKSFNIETIVTDHHDIQEKMVDSSTADH